MMRKETVGSNMIITAQTGTSMIPLVLNCFTVEPFVMDGVANANYVLVMVAISIVLLGKCQISLAGTSVV